MNTIPERYLIAATKALAFVNEHYPRLSANGWPYRYGERMAPMDPIEVPHIATCLAFIENGPVKLLKSLRGEGSYTGKHSAEHWGARVGFEPYVTNGAFISACLSLELPCKEMLGTPNSATGVRVSEHWKISFRDDSRPRFGRMPPLRAEYVLAGT
jgi:hypothetical protein